MANELESAGDGPAAVVRAFIAAMNEWEKAAWARARALRGTDRADEHWEEAGRTLAIVHEAFLTPRKRVYAEQPSFQNPPAYDPAKESVTDETVSGKRATVETLRNAVLGGGAYRYALQHDGTRWRIDSLKWQADGKWQSSIL